MQLLELLPNTAAREKVDLVVMAWDKTVDRTFNFTDVIRALQPLQQISACQILGYANVYNPRKPNMRYRLRMWRPDELEVRPGASLNAAVLDFVTNCSTCFALVKSICRCSDPY